MPIIEATSALVETTQPGLVELEEQDLLLVTGGASVIATDISLFALGLGTGASASTNGQIAVAFAGTNGAALAIGHIGSITATY